MTTLAWKRRLGRCLGPLTERHDRRVILLYHSIGRHPPAVTEVRFREQLSWLAEHATFSSVRALAQPAAVKGLHVAISFDDGYASLHDCAAGILQAHGAGATVYLNTGRIGADCRYASDPSLGHYPGEHFLTWPEVHALHHAGWSIGSHGVEHLDLTVAPAGEVERQLLHSRQDIEARLGEPCEDFAYTWGRFNAPLQELVRRSGYRTAVCGLHGPVTDQSDPTALPRIDVRAEYELADFVQAVKGAWDYLGAKQRLARAIR